MAILFGINFAFLFHHRTSSITVETCHAVPPSATTADSITNATTLPVVGLLLDVGVLVGTLVGAVGIVIERDKEQEREGREARVSVLVVMVTCI